MEKLRRRRRWRSRRLTEAQANLGGGLLESLRVPDMKELGVIETGTFQVVPCYKPRGSTRAFDWRARNIRRARTHVQAAVLGDAAEGTPLIFGRRQATARHRWRWCPAEQFSIIDAI